MPNLPMSVLTVPTEIEGEVVPTSYEIKDATARAGVTATVDLLKDTTGWLVGNELELNMLTTKAIWNGVTLEPVENGVHVYGTASGVVAFNIAYFDPIPNKEYVLIGTPTNAPNQCFLRAHDGATTYTWQVADVNGTGVTIKRTNSNRFWVDIRIADGETVDLLFKPMLIDAKLFALNPSYRPHHVSVEEEIQDIYDFNAKTGVHQLTPTKLSYLKTRNTAGTWTGNSYTINGITYDISVDDNDNVIKIAVSGNSTAYSEFLFTDRTRKDLKLSSASNYKISLGHDSVRVTVGTGNSGDGSTGTYVVVGRSADNNEVEFSGIDKYVSISIDIPSGINISTPVDIYPLLRYAEDINNGYGVFAMTNRELTDAVQSILPNNCKIHRYSFSNNTTPKNFTVGSTPLVIIGKHNGGANISVFFVVANTDVIATITDVGNKFTLTKDANNVFTITSSEAYWSLVFIGDTIPTVTNAS